MLRLTRRELETGISTAPVLGPTDEGELEIGVLDVTTTPALYSTQMLFLGQPVKT